MYNFALFLHIISAFLIGYVALYGVINRVFIPTSNQLRINLILLSAFSVLSLLTSAWMIQIAGFSHSSLWISISYALWILLIIINEVFIRRKYTIEKRAKTKEINFSIEYSIMTLIVVLLTLLMIYKP
ncbi:MAG: hypothetical protein CL715_06130 [Chloroflexi bacterium]|jgi:uncharacterized membrane protein|nr:hypothetical protein [Chloroflexota bacterium]|tara:strand:+ start:46 stop:429 length:384 start_codon:yes stop_codon:yes gene_type:complete